MKRWFSALLVALMTITGTSYAQDFGSTKTLTTAASSCVGSSTACGAFNVAGQGAVAIQLTGTFTGVTAQFEQTVDGTTWVSVPVTPSGGGATVTSATDVGVWSANVSGISVVRVRLSAISTGAVVVTYGVASAPPASVVTVVATGRLTGKTAAQASVATYTAPVDGSYEVDGNANVTTYSSGSFQIRVTYTDETNTSVTFNLQNFSAGGFGQNVNAAGAFSSVAVHIRVKGGTTITILTGGTFTSLTYNVEGAIKKIS